jgi:hypothetical protein
MWGIKVRQIMGKLRTYLKLQIFIEKSWELSSEMESELFSFAACHLWLQGENQNNEKEKSKKEKTELNWNAPILFADRPQGETRGHLSLPENFS